MLNVSKEFLETITSNVRFREMKKIEVSDTEDFATSYFIDNELSEVKTILQGRLFYTNMKQLNGTILGNHDLQGKFIKYYRGVIPIDDIETEYWADYGIFRVNKVDYEDDTNKTKILAHDLMLKSMQVYKPNDMNLTYPLTVKTLYERLLTVIGLERYEINNFPNQNYIINKDVYINRDVTYREVLDDICNLTGSTTSIKDNKVHLYQFEETGLTLSQNLASSMEIGEKIGKFNVLNLAREPQNDNYPYPLDFTNIPEKDRVEFIFSNNELINNDREALAPLIFPLINNFDYYTFNHNAQGYGIFNVGDIVTVEDQKGVKYNSIVTDQVSTFKGMVLSETESKVISNLKPEYSKPNQLQKLGREMYFIVDQQNGIIEGLINEISEVKQETSRLTLEVDKIQTEVSQIHLGNIIPNLNMYDFDMTGWLGNGLALYTLDAKFYNGLTYGATAYPIRVPEAMSDFGLSFFHSGELFSPFGYKVPKETFSWRGRVKNFAPFSITVYEYKSMAENSYKNTIFNFNLPQLVNELTLNLENDTQYVKIGIKVANASPSNRVIFYDMMFNAGVPRDWYESAQDVMIYAQSTRTQLSDRITDEVSIIDSDMNVIKATQTNQGNSISNIITENGTMRTEITQNTSDILLRAKLVDIVGMVKFNDLSNNSASTIINGANIRTGTISADRINFNGATGTNVNLSGKITASSGNIGDFSINGGNLFGDGIILSKSAIWIGDASINSFNYVGGGHSIQFRTDNLIMSGSILLAKSGSKKTLYVDSIVLSNPTSNANLTIAPIETPSVQADAFRPIFNNQALIGLSNMRFSGIYLTSQPNVSSDTRLKQNILPVDEEFIRLFGDNVQPKVYNMYDQTHFGYIAQDVERVLWKYCYEKYGRERANEEVKNFALLHKDVSYQSLLYGELAVIMDAYNRMRNQELEDRIKKLEERYNDR